MRYFKVLYFFLLLSISSFAQAALGKWTEHLPYSAGRSVAKAGNRIYCAANPSIFYVDLTDNSIHKVSKVNGLSDLDANVVEYNSDNQTLIIGYSSGNLDLIKNDVIINIPDIERSFVQASKKINNIYTKDNLAYLATGFGIVVADIQKNEIKETYILGSTGEYIDVQDIAFKGDTLFAATEKGIKWGLNSKNLASFLNWNTISSVPEKAFNSILNFNDNIYANLSIDTDLNSDTLFKYENGSWNKLVLKNYNNDKIYNLDTDGEELIVSFPYSLKHFSKIDEEIGSIYTYNNAASPNPRNAIKYNGSFWIADDQKGLVSAVNSWGNQIYLPSGPTRNGAWDVEYQDGVLWMAHGTLLPSMKFKFTKNGISRFQDNNWTSYYGGAFDSIVDIHKVIIDPNDAQHVYAASFGNGLIEFKNGAVQNILNNSNSFIQPSPEWPRHMIGGFDFDSKNNLWISVASFGSSNVGYPLVAYDGKTTYGFDINKYLGGENWVRQIHVDKKNGFIWILSYTNGIIVYDYNGTLSDPSDDRSVLLKQGETTGNLHNTHVNCIEEDQDGKLWFGTDEGIFVINNPSGAFDGTAKAEQIIIDVNGSLSYLLETEIVTSIKVDGGNRKWFATEGGGVFLFNEEGTKEIYHFTTKNSPIISDLVYDVEVNGNTGEVLFSTDKGLVSFMADATDADQYTGPTYAYPNPVPPGYNGEIGIKGLAKNSQVKITDVTGNVIYEARSEGGMVKWNGRSLSGKKAQSGVYVVFSVTDDGSETAITKILLLN